MLEPVHALGVEVDAALDVPHERVVRKAVPQPGDDVVELARATVTLIVLYVLFQSEVERCVGVRCRDDVPACATATDVIERREAARDVKRLVEGRRRGRDEANMLCCPGERGEQRERFERGHRVAALQRLHRHVEDR